MSHSWASGCDWSSECRKINDFMQQSSWEDAPRHIVNNFDVSRRQMMAYLSNKLERVLDSVSETQVTHLFLNDDPPPEVKFAVENGGQNTDQWVRQYYQYDLALQYLNACSELSLETLKESHRIMLSGGEATEHDSCDPGVFRTQGAFAGDYTFPDASKVTELVDQVLHRFNSDEETNPIFKAADLAVGIVSVHPFTNGNGRMSRILFAHTLMKNGFPWPVVLSNGHKKAYKHYISALRKAQGRDDYSEFYALAVASVVGVVSIFKRFEPVT